jgi:hypothetical protein
VTILSKPDSSMQQVAPGDISAEQEGWYTDAPKVGKYFSFCWVDANNQVCYKDTSKVVSVFGTHDGYIIKTANGSTYIIRELLDGG